MTGLVIATGYWLAAIAVFASSPWVLKHRGVAHFLLAGSTGGAALAITLTTIGSPLFEIFASLTIYAFLCELFIFLFTLVEGSISVATLIRIYNGLPTRATSEADLYQAVSQRIEAMKTAGLIVQAYNRFLLTARGASFLQVAQVLKQFLHPASPK